MTLKKVLGILLPFLICCSIILLIRPRLIGQSYNLDSIFKEGDKVSSDTGKLKLYGRLVEDVDKELSNEAFRRGVKLAKHQTDVDWNFRIEWSRGIHLEKNNLTSSIAHFEQMIDVYTNKVDVTSIGDIYLKLSELTQKRGDLKNGEHYASKARDCFVKAKNQNDVGRANYFLSLVYRLQGKPKKALEFLDTAFIQVDQKNYDLTASIYNNKGRVFRGLGVYDSAKVYYEKGLNISLENDDKKFISKFLNNLGNVAHSKGDLSDALKYYLQSLDVKRELNNKRGLAVAYHNVGAVRVDLNSFEEAIEDFTRSMELAQETDYTIVKIHNAQKLGNCLNELGKTDEALKSHQEALQWSKKIGFESGKVDAYVNLAEDYKSLAQYPEAAENLMSAIKLAEKIGKRAHLGFALTSLAETYMLMNDNSSFDGQRKLVLLPTIDIERLLKQGAQIAQETENFNGIETSLTALRNYYRSNKLFKQEAEISDRYIRFRDSLFNNQSAQAISEWETQYKTAEREREIEILKKDKEFQQLQSQIQKNRYLWATVILCLLGALGYTMLHYKLKNRRVRQMEALRNKISSDLHDDVGSILTGLAMQAEILELTASEADKNAHQRIHEMARSAMSRTRDAVWALDASKDTWEALIDRMKDHADAYITPSPMDYSFDVKEPDFKMILPDIRQQIYLIFKEAITNSIKHSNGDHINIQLSVINDKFRMSVKDNGVVNELKTSGIGLESMSRRSKKIDGQILFHTEDGFELELIVPV